MRLLKATLLLSSLPTSLQSSASRQLVFEKIGRYSPQSLVTSQNAIDLDQKMINDILVPLAVDGFNQALPVYENGAHSEPIAKLTLSPVLGVRLAKGAAVDGFNPDLTGEVKGTLVDDYEPGTAVIEVAYDIRESQSDYVKCQVGGSTDPVIEGCFHPDNRILVAGQELQYSYDIDTGNINGQSIKLFSSLARKRLFECSEPGDGCPYADYDSYRSYYGAFEYADQWVSSAALGTATTFDNGNVNFDKLDEAGRYEAFQKGTLYLHFFMQVIGQMEKAIDHCSDAGTAIGFLDQAVAYYTGSLQGSNGLGDGVLLYASANKMCRLFSTCGEDSDEPSGLAYVNHKVIGHFTDAQIALSSTGRCDTPRWYKSRITEFMLVPIIQVILFEAHERASGKGDARSYGAGAAATAAVLPYLADCSADAAQIVYDQMRVDKFGGVSFSEVKNALESQYECLGIQCGEIGGKYDTNTRSFFTDAEPCSSGGQEKKSKKKKDGSGPNGLAIGLACGGAALVLLIVLFSNFCGVKAAPAPTGLSASEGAEAA